MIELRRSNDIREPGFGGRGVEARVEVEAIRGERIEHPVGGKRGAQLVFGDAARTPVAGLAVAEAHEVEVASRAQDGVQRSDVLDASVVVVKDVEQPAVNNRVKRLAERVEVACVEHLEAGVDVALGGLVASDLDGARGDVDAEGLGAASCSEDGVLARAAAGVEQRSMEGAGLSKADE
jgi:hypothetical protein